MVADPRAVAARAAEPRTRALAHLAQQVTEAPWALRPGDRARAHAAGLRDDEILHTVLLAALFGHLNRMADSVGIALDYAIVVTPPHAEPATPPYLRPARGDWPDDGAKRALDPGQRAGSAEALAAWRRHVLERDEPLSRRQRALIAQAVAERLGDAAGVRDAAQVLAQAGEPAPALDAALDAALVATADAVTLAPWRLGAASVARLRDAGVADEPVLFDAHATASSCTTFSRIRVALAALGA